MSRTEENMTIPLPTLAAPEVLLEPMDAGQIEPIVSRLRGLVRDYPAGIGVIKEFLQNADDAGATWVRFVLDLRTHPADALPNTQMAALMGPALLIESDQDFSAKDLHDIQRIGEEGKVRDAGKTGKFGVGFNTAYNITDYPSFATNDLIMCFDPHRDVVAKEGGRPGGSWRLADLWRVTPNWPAAFGLDSGVDRLTRRTVFRLPLRTPSLASEERIAPTPCPPEQVEAIFDELSTWGSSLLLFLRSVLDVRAEIIWPDGTPETRVAIDTENPEAVSVSRGRVSAARDGQMAHLLQRWGAGAADLPSEVYTHALTVRRSGRCDAEVWRVSQGLFLGADDTVLEAARHMGAIREKAIPLGGAAVRVAGGVGDELWPVTTRGHLFCTLPLPHPTPLAFHVNAFFSVDTSRSQITHGDTVGNAGVRANWNAVLLRHVVPAAVTKLFLNLTAAVPGNGVDAFYALWPDPNALQGPLVVLGESLYAELAIHPLLRVQRGEAEEWQIAADVRPPAFAWSTNLEGALIQDGLALPKPAVPTHVIRGLAAVGEEPKQWAPAEIREWLRVAQDPACRLAAAPRHCLRDRERIIELLRFCSEDGRGDITGLPLALMADGTLRAFNRGCNVFLADSAVREIFSERPHWFLDAGVAEQVGLRPGRAAVHQVDTATAIRHLSTHLEPVNGRRAWETGGGAAPNEVWLVKLFRWLTSLPDVASHLEALKKHALIPDDRGTLWPPGTMATPLLPDDGVAKDLRAALRAFGLPVVDGSPALVSVIRQLAARCTGLVWGVTGRDVVDTLATVPSPGSTIPSNAEARVKLLTWLAEQDAEQPLDAARRTKLSALRLWRTEDDEALAAANDPDLFLSTGYKPPPLFTRATLLYAGPESAWRPLLLRLQVPELDLPSFLSRFFLPGYARLDEPGRVRALRWLRDEGWPALAGDTAAAVKWREEVKKSALIRGADGRSHRANELYHPEAEDTLALLGPVAVAPDVFGAYSDDPGIWLVFFAKLGMWRQPRQGDLVARVDQLLRDAAVSDPDATDGALMQVLDHVEGRWEKFDEATRTYLANELRERPWVPTMQAPARAEGVAALATPTSRRMRPRDVYPQRLMHLAASQIVFFARGNELRKELRAALGMPAEVTPAVVLAHFQLVQQLWSQPGHGGLTAAAVGTAASEVYRFIGLRHRTSTGMDSVEALLVALRRVGCVWDTESSRFRLARHTFAERVPFFGGLRAHVPAQGVEATGLDALGRRAKPTAEDFAEFLSDLSEDGARQPLDAAHVKMALHAWKELAAFDELKLPADVPILTTRGVLVPVGEALVDDAPWWHGRLAAAPLPWVHRAIDPRVAGRAGGVLASVAVEEVRVSWVEAAPRSVVGWCADRQDHLRTEQMLSGLIRLLAHVHEVAADELDADDLREKLSVTLTPLGRLRTGLVCGKFDLTQPFGEEDVACLLEEEGGEACVFVTTADPERVVPALAKALNRRLGDLGVTDLAPLEAIVKCRVNEIDIRLDARGIRKFGEVEEEDFSWAEQGETADAGDLQDQDVEPQHEPETDGSPDAPEDESVDPDRAATHSVSPVNSSVRSGTTPGGLIQPWTGHGRRVPPIDTPPRERQPLSDRVPPSETPAGAGGDAPRPPPTVPHLGQPTARSKGRGQFYSYLEPREPTGGTVANPMPGRLATEQAALDHVDEIERGRGSTLTPMAPSNEGYDREILVPGEAEARIVEVKGLGGNWDARGVRLTPAELRAAHHYGDRYWVYVVEYAKDPARRRLFRIRGPANQVTAYCLDHGWMVLDEPEAEALPPAPGLTLLDGDAVVGVIESVEPRGEALRLTVKTESGEVRRVNWNPSRHSLQRRST
jgi:hypothetical protein